MNFRIFISSVQSEFVDERRRLAEIGCNCQGTVRVQSEGAAVAPVVAPEINDSMLPNNTQGRILMVLKSGERSRQEIAAALCIVKKARSLALAIDGLIADDLIERTISDSKRRNSRLQKYRLTAKGVELL